MFKVSAVGLVFVTLILTATTVSAEPIVGANINDEECISVAYVYDVVAQLDTLIGPNKTVIGSDVLIYSTCGDYSVYYDSNLIGGSDFAFYLQLPSGEHTLSLYFSDLNNTTHDFGTFYAFAGAEDWTLEQGYVEDSVTVTTSQMWWDEIVAHSLTVIILFFMTTGVVYRVARYRIDWELEPVI